MLFAESLAKAYGAVSVLRDVSFMVGDGEHAALVGPNGCGKSTILRLLSGDETADGGRAGHRGASVGFLRQEAGLDSGRTLRAELWAAFPEAKAIEDQLEQIAARIERGEGDLDALIARQSDLFAEFEAIDGYRIDKRIGQVLRGLGFAADDGDRPCHEFSGGWRMRIALAKVLVRRPENMILDEPTNHLDAAAREWLAGDLQAYKGTLLIVAHDAAFLDQVAERVLDLRDGEVTSYTGGYTDYQRQKAEKIAAQNRAAERQERELDRQQRWVDRFRAKATKASAVKSREKAMARVERIDRVGTDRQVRFQLQKAARTDLEVLVVDGLSHAYDDHPVLLDVSLIVERGQKVVLVGPNGGGKSTLLRLLAGDLEPVEGAVHWDDRATLGYYDQHQDEALDPRRSVLDEVRGVAGEHTDGQLRDILGRFLFSGDDVFKPVGVLSGGERSRVALARFLIRPANVLLLDEPTNHLDVPTRRQLVDALATFDGTVICASHDPAILGRVATRVFEVRDAECRERARWDRDEFQGL